jgi:hypothetical protein
VDVVVVVAEVEVRAAVRVRRGRGLGAVGEAISTMGTTSMTSWLPGGAKTRCLEV